MTRYIALLAGINVGSRRVKMDVLRQYFTELGFSKVKTYIASGNVFFESDQTNTIDLELRIEKYLEDNLGYKVPTFVRSVEEIESLILHSVFKDKLPKEDERYCVLFVNELPQNAANLPIKSSKDDMSITASGDRALFIVWQIINGRPPSGNFPKGLLPTKTTTRFYHTLVKILAAAKNS